MQSVLGLILAAGRGSRMGEITATQPKGLISVNGKPLIDWQIDAMRSAGIGTVGIVTGYMSELLQSRGDEHFRNDKWEATSMVESLRCASAWLNSNGCIISYSDIIYDRTAVDLLLNSKADIAITYDPNWHQLWSARFKDPLSDAETFRVSTSGILLEIGGVPKSIDEIQGQYMGLLRITPRGWHVVEEVISQVALSRRPDLHMTSLLELIVELAGFPIYCYPYIGLWAELDSISDIAIANHLFS